LLKDNTRSSLGGGIIIVWFSEEIAQTVGSTYCQGNTSISIFVRLCELGDGSV
jgi:hypothetical protein